VVTGCCHTADDVWACRARAEYDYLPCKDAHHGVREGANEQVGRLDPVQIDGNLGQAQGTRQQGNSSASRPTGFCRHICSSPAHGKCSH